MSRDDDAHYLHEHHGLKPLIRPVVHGARHMAFGPGDALYAVDGDGVLQKVHPAMGTEALGEVGPVVGLAAARQRVALVGADGVLRWRDRAGAAAGEAPHSFTGEVVAHVAGERTLVVGETADGRLLEIWTDTRRTLRVQLPAHADARADGDDTVLFWASDAGLETLRLSEGGRFAGTQAAPLRLTATAGPVVGLGADGVAVFREGGPALVEESGVTAVSCTPDGTFLLLGTEGGELLVVREGREDHPARLQAHDAPVHAIAVHRNGDLVASASDGLVLWGLDP